MNTTFGQSHVGLIVEATSIDHVDYLICSLILSYHAYVDNSYAKC